MNENFFEGKEMSKEGMQEMIGRWYTVKTGPYSGHAVYPVEIQDTMVGRMFLCDIEASSQQTLQKPTNLAWK